MNTRIQPAVFGATGYSGFELVRLLARHPGAKKPLLLRRNGESGGYRDLSEAYPQLSGNGGFPFESFSWERMKQAGADVVFFATPHEFSRELVPEAISHGFRVIDLSGAWRLKQAATRKVYGFAEGWTELDDAAVYGLPELHADAIAQATLLANPGCYSTSIILALAPWIRAGFVDLQQGIICDSKSGVSGAGKQPTPKTHFVEVDGDFSAYNVFGHRHTGEMLEQLGLENGSLQFTPHCCRFRAAFCPPST
jgi:N-acetyl-gamma-glutamyl-phosphate reductase